MTLNHKLTDVIKGRFLDSVQQSDTHLVIQFDDGSTMLIGLSEASSSVMVRDRRNGTEYAD